MEARFLAALDSRIAFSLDGFVIAVSNRHKAGIEFVFIMLALQIKGV